MATAELIDQQPLRAVRYSKQLLRRDYSHIGALYVLGQALYQMGQIQEAFDYMAIALSFYPHNLHIKECYDSFKEKLEESR
jgi:tetratricopeptide (TPR) repeat protein